jgi:hypothetical protein
LFTGFWPPEKRKEFLVAKNLPKNDFRKSSKAANFSRISELMMRRIQVMNVQFHHRIVHHRALSITYLSLLQPLDPGAKRQVPTFRVERSSLPISYFFSGNIFGYDAHRSV